MEENKKSLEEKKLEVAQNIADSFYNRYEGDNKDLFPEEISSNAYNSRLKEKIEETLEEYLTAYKEELRKEMIKHRDMITSPCRALNMPHEELTKYGHGFNAGVEMCLNRIDSIK